MQLARADGLPEPLASLRLILGVRPGLQPRRHQAAPIGCLCGLGGVKVDAAVHQLHLFAGKGMGFFIITADKCDHVVAVVELTGRTHFHRSEHQYMLAVQREEVRALPHFAVHVVAARQHGNKVPVETVLALEQYGCTAAILGQGNGHGRVGAVCFAPDLRVTEIELAESLRQVFLGQHRVAGRFFVIQSIAHSNALGLNIPHFTIRLLFGNHAGIQQKLTSVVHFGGRTGEAAGAVVRRGIRSNGAGQILPMQQVCADRVSPVHRTPLCCVGVVLVKLVVLSLVVGKAVRVIHPAHKRGQVVGRALCRRNGSAVLFLIIACFLQNCIAHGCLPVKLIARRSMRPDISA